MDECSDLRRQVELSRVTRSMKSCKCIFCCYRTKQELRRGIPTFFGWKKSLVFVAPFHRNDSFSKVKSSYKIHTPINTQQSEFPTVRSALSFTVRSKPSMPCHRHMGFRFRKTRWPLPGTGRYPALSNRSQQQSPIATDGFNVKVNARQKHGWLAVIGLHFVLW